MTLEQKSQKYLSLLGKKSRWIPLGRVHFKYRLGEELDFAEKEVDQIIGILESDGYIKLGGRSGIRITKKGVSMVEHESNWKKL